MYTYWLEMKLLLLVATFGLVHSTFVVHQFDKEPQPIQDFQDYIGNYNFDGNIWVVLVAGSNGYFNYRHQVSTMSLCSAVNFLLQNNVRKAVV